MELKKPKQTTTHLLYLETLLNQVSFFFHKIEHLTPPLHPEALLPIQINS